MSKHGGSPASGLVLPAGIDGLQPVAPGSLLVESELTARRRVNLERERQFERRRLAAEFIDGHSTAAIAGLVRFSGDATEAEREADRITDAALMIADKMMQKTPVPPRDEANRE